MANKREIIADEREEVAGKIELAISIDDAEYDGNKLRYEILDLLESKGLEGAEIWGQKTYSCSRKDTKIEGSIQEKQEKRKDTLLQHLYFYKYIINFILAHVCHRKTKG